jgi:hypothetical protein
VNSNPMNVEMYLRKRSQKLTGCFGDCRFPRGLVLENNSGTEGGSIIVGRNPGKANQDEIRHFQDETKGSVNDKWQVHFREKHREKHKYYKLLRKLVRQLGFSGPIIWTELVKCEDLDFSKPENTVRVLGCAQRHLCEELKSPGCSHWPLIAVGVETFKSLVFLFPSRIVIGVPHPSRGHLSAISRRHGRLKTAVHKNLEKEISLAAFHS